ncbi:transcriptional regulator [Nocardiopsis dassonvillei subsp. albirubida]|uniref:Transcriptional regulator n=1 Tax=Nocardiopsis alborubida TaxID=146802 RepID=A0A7X6RTY6_9ACTN|nr:transcriptional regulator [Nocardiopsis alborubida]
MRFRLLGPLEINGPQGLVPVPAGRQQIVLSALLLELERVVSVDHLIDVLWEYDPPDTARTQVQICVSRLRRLLKPTGASIKTRPPGYLLVVDPGTVDVHVQRTLVREAAALNGRGHGDEVAAALRAAADLWRGPTLSGIGSTPLAAKATRLDEERLSVIESYVDVELDLGRHSQLVGELRTLVGEHPLRERLRAQLMLALYRSGRQAEALDTYRTGRGLLVEELGLEPGEELRGMENAILAGDPVLQAPAVPAVPAAPAASPVPSGEEETPRYPEPGDRPYQLPTDTADFVGREDVTRTIQETLVGGGRVGVAVLMGRPGVGKSATAMRVAHALAAEHYPDGQLYCDLRATRGNPLTSSDVLSRFLRSLGAPAQAIPEDVDERAVMYRGMLASRRVLVVLDDAADEAQLLPLIPAGAGCGVVVTSRAFLTGLPGATQVQLDTLPGDASIELLSRVLGEARVRAEPEAARALVRAVGRLPLALRIISARLAARPRWRLAAMVERLADERNRLDELAHGDMTVRASLSLTYDGIEPRTARAFRLLGTMEGPTIPAWTAGALLDDGRAFPSDLVEPLVDAHMIDIIGVDAAGEPVYRFHELVRDFSRERLLREEDGGRGAAVERLLGGWLSLLDTANRRLMGGDYLRLRGEAPRWSPPPRYVERLMADPYTWLEAERANIRHAALQAVAEGLDEHSWDLVAGISLFLTRRGYLDDLSELYGAVEPVLRESGNRRGRAALMEMAGATLTQGKDDALRAAMLEEALAEFDDLGDTHGRALARRGLASLADLRGERAGAIRLCEQALEGFLVVGDLGGQWRCLMLMGYLRCLEGDIRQGRDELDRALSLAEETGDSRACAQVLRRTGLLEAAGGEYERALEHLHRARGLVEELDDPVGRAVVLRDLGRVCVRSGRRAEAGLYLERSAVLFGELRDAGEQASTERELAELG